MSSSKKTKKSFDLGKYYPLFFTIIFVFILFQYSFSTQEAIFYDLRVKYDFGSTVGDEIVLISLDEESDEFLGEIYPYTYASHYHMFENLMKDGPLIVNYFIGLQEPEGESDKKEFSKFSGLINDYTTKGGLFRYATDMDSWGEQLPPKGMKKFGYSIGLINVDNAAFAKDDVSRRTILNISGDDTIHLWTANEMRKSKGLPAFRAGALPGAYYLREADATFALFRYGTNPSDDNPKIKKIPYHRVRVGNFPKGFFKGKTVLIGPSYISNASNYVLTPFNKEQYKASKLSMHAEIIYSLFNGKTVYPISIKWTHLFAILIAIFLSITISKVKPTHGLWMTVLVMFGVLVTSFFAFSLFGIWIYVTHMTLTVFVVYYIWVPFRAIGEYQRRYAIQEETKLLKKVENLKQNFISLMSHDLKTPVAKIAGLADIMIQQKHYQGDDGKKNIEHIKDSTIELNKFISSILDLTKVESQNLTLNMTSKDVNSIIEQVIGNLRYEASQKNVKVNFDLGPLYPIQMDINLMNRVLSNLIENAIKYSGEGSEVLVKTYDDENWVYISIKDNGVGIGQEDLENIFEKFYRVKNDASHTIKGTGLGLYLVKYFVELHGGSIKAESIVGQGTNFQIKLKNE